MKFLQEWLIPTPAVQDALTDQDKAEGYILACQAKIHGEVVVDA